VAGSAVLPEVLKKVYSTYPYMTIDTFEAHYCRTQQMVLDELIDCTLTVENGTQFQGLKYIHLTQLDIRYCVNERNPLSACEYVTFEQIKDNPVVLFKDTSFHYQLIVKWFREHDSEPHVVMQSDRPYEIVFYLENLLGAGAFLSYETMYMYKNVIPLKLQNPPYVSVAIAYKKNAPLNKRVRQFLQLFA
jgi:DNA-binding transcriptional LysR family regulator